jgi:hypothetical protein
MKLKFSVSGDVSIDARWLFLVLVAVLIAVVVMHGGDASPLVQLVTAALRRG